MEQEGINERQEVAKTQALALAEIEKAKAALKGKSERLEIEVLKAQATAAQLREEQAVASRALEEANKAHEGAAQALQTENTTLQLKVERLGKELSQKVEASRALEGEKIALTGRVANLTAEVR